MDNTIKRPNFEKNITEVEYLEDRDFDRKQQNPELILKQLERLSNSKHYTLLPYQLDQVKEILYSFLPFLSIQEIVDATAHIGGDSIHFSIIFPHSKIKCIDNDFNAIKCLRNNVKFSDPNRFDIIYDSCINYIETKLPHADFFYFDPPWGPTYNSLDTVYLYLNEISIDQIINFIFKEQLTSHIILKIPKNFDFLMFNNSIEYSYNVRYVYKPLKSVNNIAYGLIHIKNLKIN